jgi:HAD superfamily hydrolase (TIGR01509 family)
MTDSNPSPVVRPAAVLWDMDGTIVDTEPYWIATEYELVAEFGGEWSDEKAHSLVGFDLRDSARIIRDQGGVDLPIDDIVNRLLDGVIERVRQRVPWRPGARELLKSLSDAGVPSALVTMSWRRFAEAVVDALPDGSFAAVITGDEVTNGKPHPEPYLAAAAALGVNAADCVAIEDSPTGVRSAVAAGCRTYAVPNVVDVPASPDYTRLESLTELSLTTLGFADAAAAENDMSPRRRWLPIVALVVVAALAAGGVWFVRRSSTAPPLVDIPVSGWAPYWILPDATATVGRHGSIMHEVSPFWFQVTGEGTVGFVPNLALPQTAELLTAIRRSGAKAVPSITDETKPGTMARLLANPERRATHVAAIVTLVDHGGYDGIDLDYEKFAFYDDKSTWPTTRPNWVAFLTELGTALHAKGKLLSVSVPPIYDTGRTPSSGKWVYDYAAMGKVVDRIRIMAYDYSTSEPGPIGPLGWTRTAVRAAKDAVADDTKLVLGVPLYGRNWVVDSSGKCPAEAQGRTEVKLRDAEALAVKRHATPVHDPNTGEATFDYSLRVGSGASACTQQREVHYVDELGARARLDLARAEHIGGVSFWALGFDTEALWKLIAPVARPQHPTSTTAP